MKYNLVINVDNYSHDIILPVEYETEYNLRKDVSNIGNVGVWQKHEKNFSFIPAHRINIITINEIQE